MNGILTVCDSKNTQDTTFVCILKDFDIINTDGS